MLAAVLPVVRWCGGAATAIRPDVASWWFLNPWSRARRRKR